MTLDCVNASNVNCAHSMDLGVVCKSYQEIFPQQCNMSTISCDPTTSTTPSINAEQSCGNSSTNGALGGIIGILLALLVAIVTGWLCTCIAFRRRNTNYKIRYAVLQANIHHFSVVKQSLMILLLLITYTYLIAKVTLATQ